MTLTPEESGLLEFALLARSDEGRQKLIDYLIPPEHMPTDPEGLALLHNAILASAVAAVDGLNELADLRGRLSLNESERTP